MPDSNELKILITGTTDQLKSAMDAAAAAVSSGVAEITGSLENLMSGSIHTTESIVGGQKMITGSVENLTPSFQKVGIQANKMAAEVKSGFASITSALSGMQSSIGSSISGMMSSFSGLIGIIPMVGTALAGLLSIEGLKSAANAALEYGENVLKLTRTIGMTTEAVSELKGALSIVGVSGDEFVSLMIMLDRQIRNNEKGLHDLGITLRDVNTGALLPNLEIMKNALQVMLQYKEGTDRNEVGIDIFRRRVQDAGGMLRLTNEKLTEGAEMAKTFGMVLSEQAALAMEKAKESSNKLAYGMHALSVKIGEAVIPVLSQLKEDLYSILPGAITVLVGALKGLETAFVVLYEVVKVFVQMTYYSLKALVDSLIGIFKAIPMALSGNFAGAWEAIKKGGVDAFADLKKAGDTYLKDEKDTTDQLKKLWGGVQEKLKSPIPKGEKEAAPKEGAEAKSRVPDWKSELEQMKEDADSFHTISLSDERAFWVQRLLLTKDGSKEERGVIHEMYEVSKKDEVNYYAVREALRKQEEGADETTWARKVELAREGVADATAEYGKGSKEQIDASTRLQKVMEGAASADLKSTIDILRLKADETADLKEKILLKQQEIFAIEMAGIADKKATEEKEAKKRELAKLMEEDAKKEIELQASIIEANIKVSNEAAKAKEHEVEMKYKLGQINVMQELDMLKNLEDQRYNFETNSYNKLLELWKKYPIDYQKVINQVQEVEQKHSDKMTATNDSMMLEMKKGWDDLSKNITGPITSTFTTFINDVFQGKLKTAGDYFKSFAKSVLDTWMSTLSKLMEKSLSDALFGDLTKGGGLTSVTDAIKGLFAKIGIGTGAAPSFGGTSPGAKGYAAGGWNMPSSLLSGTDMTGAKTALSDMSIQAKTSVTDIESGFNTMFIKTKAGLDELIAKAGELQAKAGGGVATPTTPATTGVAGDQGITGALYGDDLSKDISSILTGAPISTQGLTGMLYGDDAVKDLIGKMVAPSSTTAPVGSVGIGAGGPSETPAGITSTESAKATAGVNQLWSTFSSGLNQATKGVTGLISSLMSMINSVLKAATSSGGGAGGGGGGGGGLIGSIVGLFSGGGGGVSVPDISAYMGMFTLQAGGPVVGGSGRKDDVPILGKEGEYMQPEKSVSGYGLPVMDAIREMRIPKELLVPFAAGGWDVDRSSLAVVHSREMVLPSNLAEGVRSMVGGGGGAAPAAPGGGGPTVHFSPNFNVSAMDQQGVQQFFRANMPTLMKEFNRHLRNSNMPGLGR